MKVPFLLGRLMFGGFFIYNGLHHMAHVEELAGYARAKNVPKAKAAVIATGAMMLAGGISVAAGVKPKLGTIALLGFLGSVSPIMHNFWRVEDPAQRQADTIHFAKNLALVGAAVALMGVEEPWPISIPVLQPGVRKQLQTAWKGDEAVA